MNERGISTLEMILVLPVLLFLLFGIAEVSRVWHFVNVVALASRDGARVAAATVAPDLCKAKGESRITEILTNANLSSVSPTAVTCVDGVEAPDTQVRATVTVMFQTVVPLVGDLVPLLKNLSIGQTTIMRRE